MGQNQSRDGTVSTASTASIASTAPASGPTAPAPASASCQEAVDAYIVLRQKADGSSVREIFVPGWRCGFYKAGSTVAITLDCDLPSSGAGKYISIDAESAALLYKALLNYRVAVASAAATLPVLALYVESGFLKM